MSESKEESKKANVAKGVIIISIALIFLYLLFAFPRHISAPVVTQNETLSAQQQIDMMCQGLEKLDNEYNSWVYWPGLEYRRMIIESKGNNTILWYHLENAYGLPMNETLVTCVVPARLCNDEYYCDLIDVPVPVIIDQYNWWKTAAMNSSYKPD